MFRTRVSGSLHDRSRSFELCYAFILPSKLQDSRTGDVRAASVAVHRFSHSNLSDSLLIPLDEVWSVQRTVYLSQLVEFKPPLDPVANVSEVCLLEQLQHRAVPDPVRVGPIHFPAYHSTCFK